MSLLLAFFLISVSGHISTSFYSFRKFGAYSITNLNLDFGMNRYGFRLGLEKRQNDFGIKSLTVEIDSIINGYRLTIGEKHYHINGPLSTTLNLWGVTLRGRDGDFFLGKTKDPGALLTPSFEENRYTIGFRLQKNISYYMPVEFYLLRKSDNHNYSGILDNTSLGTNVKYNLGKRVSLGSQLWASISDIGFGSAFMINSSYTAPKYGGSAYFRNIFNNYTTTSNLVAQSGNWFRTFLYQNPLEWISFSQDITYSSIYDMGVGLSTAIKKAPLPGLGYGIHISPGGIGQYINTSYQYKKFFISSGYGWSKSSSDFGIKIGQAINNYQIWTGFQYRDNVLFQFGGMFPFSSKIKVKSFFNIAGQYGYITRSTGIEFSVRLLRNFNFISSYEWANYNNTNNHYLSLSVTNSLLFDEIGFGFISGKVFMDVNNNGFFDIEDRVVPDIEVILDGGLRAKTNKKGDYSFSFIKRGEHTVSLDLGVMPAEIGPGKRKYTVGTKFLKQTKADFALDELGLIEGTIFYDENGDGEQNPEEVGVHNVVIKINGSLTTTNDNGKYRIANLAPGTYTIGVNLLPPETILVMPQVIYIHLKRGEKFVNKPLGVIKKERPVNKTIFGE